MTTKVTVDAHAGWPVKVTLIDSQTVAQRYEHIVPPGELKDFYIYNGLSIVGISEMDRPNES